MKEFTRKRTRFCGIDIAKNKHVACVIDREGKQIIRSQSFANDAEGFQRILDRLKEVGGPAKVAIAMEATGHYWYSLHDFLIRNRYHVVVLNPIQTAKQVTKGIRKTQPTASMPTTSPSCSRTANTGRP